MNARELLEEMPHFPEFDAILPTIKKGEHKGHITHVLHNMTHGGLHADDAHDMIANVVQDHDLTLSQLGDLMNHVTDSAGECPATDIGTEHFMKESSWDSYYDYGSSNSGKKDRSFTHGALGVIAGASLAHPVTRHIILTHAKHVGGNVLIGAGKLTSSVGKAVTGL